MPRRRGMTHCVSPLYRTKRAKAGVGQGMALVRAASALALPLVLREGASSVDRAITAAGRCQAFCVGAALLCVRSYVRVASHAWLSR